MSYDLIIFTNILSTFLILCQLFTSTQGKICFLLISIPTLQKKKKKTMSEIRRQILQHFYPFILKI